MELIKRELIAESVSKAVAADASVKLTIQQVAWSIIVHCQQHGDCIQAGKLVNGLKTNKERDALEAWFKAYSKINVDRDNALDSKLSKSDKRGYDADAASTDAWQNFKADVVKKAKTADQLLKALKADVDNDDTTKITPQRRAMAARIVMLYEQDLAKIVKADALIEARALIAAENAEQEAARQASLPPLKEAS
jgi:hypothetical protein